jgi:hypothetical protein
VRKSQFATLSTCVSSARTLQKRARLDALKYSAYAIRKEALCIFLNSISFRNPSLYIIPSVSFFCFFNFKQIRKKKHRPSGLTSSTSPEEAVLKKFLCCKDHISRSLKQEKNTKAQGKITMKC